MGTKILKNRGPRIRIWGKMDHPPTWKKIKHHDTDYNWHPDYPPRYEIRGLTVQNFCHGCGEEHWMWLCDDRLWQKLPKWMRLVRLCVHCFKHQVPEDGPTLWAQFITLLRITKHENKPPAIGQVDRFFEAMWVWVPLMMVEDLGRFYFPVWNSMKDAREDLKRIALREIAPKTRRSEVRRGKK